MRDLDVQLQEIRMRSEQLKEDENSRRTLGLEVLSLCACLAVLIAAALSMPAFSDVASSRTARYGSLILSTPSLGYVVIGALAFLLGICVTLLCVRLQRGGSRGSP